MILRESLRLVSLHHNAYAYCLLSDLHARVSKLLLFKYKIYPGKAGFEQKWL